MSTVLAKVGLNTFWIEYSPTYIDSYLVKLAEKPSNDTSREFKRKETLILPEFTMNEGSEGIDINSKHKINDK